ncbi:MAG: hypothetical protein JO217_15870, partial [Acidobacteriaceae bacterium]|nr:hypothetical protein [Acidobacteriaceae bacterium]
MKSSGVSQSSDRATGLELICVGLALTLLVLAADVYCYGRGFILYYGDAEAHLNISRSVIDSRTPGYDQLGSVWLPVLHVLCLPFVGSDVLWSSGLAGTIPVSLCFVIAGLFLYSAGKLTYASSLAATVVLACFALNPNLLYLAAIPMTELVFLAGLALLLYAGISFQRDNGQRAFWFGVFSCWWVSLTRYEGWFLIPFAAAWFGFSARRKRLWTSIAFVSFASLAPIYWLAHNWFITGNPFDFFNGPYSPHAIQGNRNYPGYHDWKTAFAYYTEAAKLCAGPCLLIFGAVGLLLSRFRHTLLAVAFLLLPLLFYVWSIHSSSVPVFVPTLWPNSYYNTRYGIVAVVWAAFACGAIVMAVPARWRRFALVLPVLVLSPWLIHP